MLLDVGCRRNKKQGYYGVDVYKQSHADSVQDATCLAFKSRSIQKVYSRRCIQHIPEWKEAVKEFHRILTVGGELHLIVSGWLPYIAYRVGYFKKTYTTFHFFTKRKLVRELVKAGFKIVYAGKTRHDIDVTAIKITGEKENCLLESIKTSQIA